MRYIYFGPCEIVSVMLCKMKVLYNEYRIYPFYIKKAARMNESLYRCVYVCHGYKWSWLTHAVSAFV